MKNYADQGECYPPRPKAKIKEGVIHRGNICLIYGYFEGNLDFADRFNNITSLCQS